MTHVYLVPKWFFGFDIMLELIFAAITFLVSYYAYRVYRISGERDAEIFGVSFFFISLAYFLWAVLNFFVVVQLNEYLKALDLKSFGILSAINNAAIYTHFILYLIGLVLLTYVTSRVKNKRAFFIIMFASVLGLIMARNITFFFYALSSILLLTILYHYSKYYYKNKNKHVKTVMIAFLFLLVGSASFLFVGNSYFYYVIGHLFKLVGYIFILSNLVILWKHGKKKK